MTVRFDYGQIKGSLSQRRCSTYSDKLHKRRTIIHCQRASRGDAVRFCARCKKCRAGSQVGAVFHHRPVHVHRAVMRLRMSARSPVFFFSSVQRATDHQKSSRSHNPQNRLTNRGLLELNTSSCWQRLPINEGRVPLPFSTPRYGCQTVYRVISGARCSRVQSPELYGKQPSRRFAR